jgi:hypothetical protein
MRKNKKIYLAISVLVIIIALSGFQKSVRAEDDKNESDDHESPSTVIDTSPEKKSPKKTETITEYRKLSDIVTQIITTVTKHDSDGDGIYDDEDPHPTINEYFIVKDDNSNGIDDRYEQQS